MNDNDLDANKDTGTLLRTLAARRFEVVGSHDLEGAMAVLTENPVFELRPLGLKLEGQENVRRYYAGFFQAAQPLRTELIDTLISETALALELKLTYQAASGGEECYRLLAIMPLEGDRFNGERLYGDERLFRRMFGAVWSLLTPLEE